MTEIPDEIMAKAREVVAKFPTPPDNRNACVNIVAAALSERTASEAALKEAREVIESLMDIKRGDEFETARAFLAKT
jgi:hypothetical protein